MRQLMVAFAGLMLMLGCSGDKELATTDLSGLETRFPLYQGSQFPVSGSVLFQEKIDGSARITVELSGLSGTELFLPVHLHQGSIDTPDALLLAQLNPVTVKTQRSVTDLKQLIDETPISYQDLIKYNGSIKIHLAETGEGRKIILAAGNIGNLYDGSEAGRTVPIAVCKTE